MNFWGVTVEDVASALGVASIIVGITGYLFRNIVVNPLRTAIDNLSLTVDKLSETNEKQNEQVEKEIHQHDILIKEHAVRLNFIEEKEGIKSEANSKKH